MAPRFLGKRTDQPLIQVRQEDSLFWNKMVGVEMIPTITTMTVSMIFPASNLLMT